ncbi:MAG: hypothetical protein ACRD1H_16255 [Vicinamibacterales bacterium]
MMAGRYWPQRHLVGPALYPFYWPVLKVSIALAVAIHVAAGVILIATGTSWPEAGRGFARVWDAVLAVFTWTTLAFALVDRHVTRAGDAGRWRPAPSGADGAGQGVHDIAARAVRKVGLSITPLAQFLVNAVIAGWWLLALKIPALVFGPAAAVLGFAPIWDRLYLPIAVLTVVNIVRQYLRLTRPHLESLLAATRVAIRAVSLVVLYFLLRAREWVVLRGTGAEHARFNMSIDINGRHIPLVEFINYSIACALIAIAILCAVGIVRGLRAWFAARGASAAHS